MVLFIKLDQLLTVFFWFLGPLLLFTTPASLLRLLLLLLRYMEKNKANDMNLWRRLMNDHHLFGQSHSFCSRNGSKVIIDNSKCKNVRDK